MDIKHEQSQLNMNNPNSISIHNSERKKEET